MNKFVRYVGVLLFLMTPSCCLADPLFSARKPFHSVEIKDGDLKDLNFRCETDPDGIIGNHTLQPGERAGFHVDIDQLYVCHFKWQSRQKDVIVINNALINDCIGEFDKDCVWEVRSNGFWFFHIKNKWIKKYDW